MPTPFTSGSPSIANRWLHGAATVLWVGDSIGVALEDRIFQALRVTPAGIGVRGAAYADIGANSWFDTAAGGLQQVALLSEQNYSPFPTREILFSGAVVPPTGQPAALEARFASDGTAAYLLATRTDLTLGGGDWLADGPPPRPRCRVIHYRNAQSSSLVGRNSVRGSASSSVAKGAGPLLSLNSSTPAWVADDFAITPPAAGEDVILQAQSVDGIAIAGGLNFVTCCAIVTSGAATGLTFIPASVDGWDVTRWLDTTYISDDALGGVLPLLGLTDIVVSVGQYNTTSESSEQFLDSLLQLVDRLRLVAPGASIVFCPTWDTNNAGSAPHLAGFADAHYAAHLATPNSAFLNLYGAAGSFATLNALGYIDGSTGITPTDAGKLYVLQTIQGLLDALLADDRVTAAGRYANQGDVEDLFDPTQVSQWSRTDADATTTDATRIQRALDRADATIDDFFRGGPYAVPLTAPAGPSAATVARWSATLAGVALYRSRVIGGTGGGTPSLTVTASGPVDLSASSTGSATSSATDPFATRVAAVYAEMAQAKSGAKRLASAPAAASIAEAPAIVM